MPKKSYVQPWEKIKRSVVLKTPWFKIYKDDLITPRGTKAEYYIHDGGDSVICVCYTNEGKFILERQYRPTLERISIDYPAGHMEPSDADPEDAAMREVEQETGKRPRTLKKLVSIDKDPGFSRDKLHIFLATDFEDGVQHFDDTEDIDFMYVSTDELKTMLSKGEISCAGCVASTMFAFKELGLNY